MKYLLTINTTPADKIVIVLTYLKVYYFIFFSIDSCIVLLDIL